MLSLLAGFQTSRLLESGARENFEQQAQPLIGDFARALALQAEALRGVQGFVSAAPDLSRAQFQRYVDSQQLRARHPGAEAYGLARLAAAEHPGHRERLMVDYLQPLSATAISPGDDLLALEVARAAADSARDGGALAASARLGAGDSGEQRLLLMLPVYRSGDATTPQERRQAFAGVVFALLLPAEVAKAIAASETARDLELQVLDLGAHGTISPGESLLDDASRAGAPAASAADLRRRTEHDIAFGGHQWRITVLGAAPQPASLALPWLVLAAGLGATALLAWRVRARRRARASGDVAAAEPPQALGEIVAGVGDVVWSMDLPDGRLRYISPAAESVYGHPPARFLEDPEFWYTLVHPGDLAAARGQAATLVQTGFKDLECRILRPDGTVRWIRDRAWVARDAEGRALRLDGITEDITERREQADRLGSLSRAVDQSPAALLVTDRGGHIEYVNSRFCELTGYSREEALGKTPRILKSGVNDPAVYENLWRTLASGNVWTGELLNRRKNGELFWEHEVISPVRDATGAITHYVAVKEDITGRRHVEQALGESERLFRSAINSIPDMFLIYGPDRRIRFVNDQILAASGFSEQQMIGCRDEELFGPTHTDAYLPSLRAAIETGTAQSVECELDFRAAGRVTLAMSFVPQLNARQEVGLVLCIAHDVSRQREHAASLDRLNRTLRMLSGCSQALVHAPDETDLLDSVCWTMLNLGGYELVSVGLIENDAARSVRPAMQAARRRMHPDLLRFTWGRDALGLGPTGTAIRTGKPALARDLAADAACAPWRAAAAEHRLRACAALPLVHDGETMGAVTIYASDPGLFDERELELLRELADDLAFGMVTRRANLARKRAEEQLHLRDRVIESSSNGILINDLTRPNNPIIYVNPAFERMTGYSAGEVIGRNPRFLIRADREQAGLERIRIALREKTEGRAVLRTYHKDGAMVWVELSMSPVRNEAGEPTHFVTILNDVTERQLYQEELEHQAYHDALTGLANRNLLPDRIRQAILHAHRSGQHVAVLLLDLDHFKLVNDSLGHAVGDSLLVSVAERLSAAVREADTVARIGGDEFVVVIANAEREDHITATTQRIMDAVVEPLVIRGKELFASASIGVSVYPRDGADAEALLKNADVAMYRAKEQGRNNYQFYTPEMNARLTERINLVAGLRRALKKNEFRLYYQPLVDLRSGNIVALEVLTRWHSAQRGVVSPAVFIPVTEETGLIRPLGEWVLQNACAQGKLWQDMEMPGIVVAVNLSATQFRQKNLTHQVEQALRVSGLDPGRLELELTESVVMYNVDEVLATLRELKSIGVRISLDDFGTGYSSLSYLKRFPIDKLKIDRSFVRDVITNPEDAAIARAVIAMAHSLDMRVVAEGVETAEQLEFLRSNHCDQFQGFLYARPLSAVESTELLRKQYPPRLALIKG
ncbi:MAG TPA: EAL domain-containing protein [Burkholderiales bacterium]|nr:EAL domain-containing protein [Burkholderiales bacterium]